MNISNVLIRSHFGSSWLRWLTLQSLHLSEALALRESVLAKGSVPQQSTAWLGKWRNLGVGIASLIF